MTSTPFSNDDNILRIKPHILLILFIYFLVLSNGTSKKQEAISISLDRVTRKNRGIRYARHLCGAYDGYDVRAFSNEFRSEEKNLDASTGAVEFLREIIV